MVTGRAAELAQLEGLLADLHGGAGRALVVRGEPGIGKTTLLAALGERSGEGVTVVRAGGVESEAEIAFSALSDLLAPVVGELPALPEPQAAALAAALALGPGRRQHPHRPGAARRRGGAAVRRGASNREIAAELFLAPKTVEFHLRQLYRKLGVWSRAQLVATLARGAGLESPRRRRRGRPARLIKSRGKRTDYTVVDG